MKQKFTKLSIALAITALSAGAAAQNTSTTDEGVVINGVRWATRNLDVGGTFVENPEGYGALYQWGRPADGHENRTSGTTDVLATTDTPEHDDFILTKSSPIDWRTPQNDALWNAGTEEAPYKAVNDPSPDGWRVPTNAEMATLLNTAKVTKAWDAVKKGYTFTDKETSAVLFLPAAGFHNPMNNNMSNAGANGYYFSSCVSTTQAYYLGFGSGGNGINSFARAGGMSLRCVALNYTVTFDSNGGSKVALQRVTSGETATPPADPTRKDYIFDGWYSGSTVFDFDTPITDHITLTAQWTAGEVTPTPPVTPPVAISATEQDALRIYPNPVMSGELKIESGELQAGEPIAVYNLSGAQVAVYQASGVQTVINISHLPSGAYLVKAKNLSELVIKN